MKSMISISLIALLILLTIARGKTPINRFPMLPLPRPVPKDLAKFLRSISGP